MNKTKKAAWLATGVATIAANSINPLLISPASAAPPSLPTCDATQTDDAINTLLATYNSAAINTYKGGSKYKQLAAAVKNAQKALKGKKGKAKVAAEKNLAKAVSKRNKALADATSAASVTQFAATVTGDEVLEASRENQAYTWGKYTTRVFVKAGKVIDLCYAIDESELSEADQEESLTGYISLWPLDDMASQLVPGNSAKTAAQINASFAEQVESLMHELDPTDPIYSEWSWAESMGALSGATYTIKTFYDSIQASLIEAELISE